LLVQEKAFVDQASSRWRTIGVYNYSAWAPFKWVGWTVSIWLGRQRNRVAHGR